MRTRRDRRADRGAVIPLVAIALPVLMVMTAFAVDLGSQRVLRRELQADADVVALDLVRLADGRTTAEIEGVSDAVQATAYLDYLNGSLRRNDRPEVTTLAEARRIVVFGRWDESTDPTFTPTTDDEIPNSVKVTFDGEVRYRFQPGTGGSTRRAEAATEPIGSFSIGSRLASLDTAESELLGPLLGRLLGAPGAIDLTAGAYDGLANTNISLGELFGIVPLEIARLGLSAASPDQILATEITALEFVDVVASALEANSGDGVEAEAALAFLDLLRLNLDPTLTLTLGEVLGLGVSEPGAVADVDVNLFDLLNAGAQVANGDRLVDLDLALDAATLTDKIPIIDEIIQDVTVQAQVGVIEPPQIAVGPVGTTARTSQVRVKLDVSADVEIDVGFLDVARLQLDLPLTVEAANGTAELTSVTCAPGPGKLGLDVDTSAARVVVGHPPTEGDLLTVDPTDPSPASDVVKVTVLGGLLGDDLLSLGLAAEVETGTDQPSTSHTVDVGAVERVNAEQLGLADLVALSLQPQFLDDESILGQTLEWVLGQVDEAVQEVLDDVLNPLLGLIDSVVVRPLLDVLGVGVAGADVSALDADCDSVKLVG